MSYFLAGHANVRRSLRKDANVLSVLGAKRFNKRSALFNINLEHMHGHGCSALSVTYNVDEPATFPEFRCIHDKGRITLRRTNTITHATPHSTRPSKPNDGSCRTNPRDATDRKFRLLALQPFTPGFSLSRLREFNGCEHPLTVSRGIAIPARAGGTTPTLVPPASFSGVLS